MLERAASDLLVIGKERFELYTKQGEKFFFTRIQRCSAQSGFERKPSRC